MKYFILITSFLFIIVFKYFPEKDSFISIDTTYGLEFHEKIYNLSEYEKLYNITTEHANVTSDDIAFFYNSYTINGYTFNVYRNRKDELVISYQYDNTEKTICTMNSWGNKDNLSQIELSISDKNCNTCQITPFDNLLNRSGICVKIVDSTLVSDCFYIEIKDTPELFLFTDYGTLSIHDMNSDNCFELISSVDLYGFFYRNNAIYEISTTYKDDTKQLYYNENEHNFTIFYDDHEPVIVNIDFDTYSVIPIDISHK